MKKLLLLTATILIAGLTLPAAAQSHRRNHHCSSTEIYISGYHPCGSPIYSKRVLNVKHYQSKSFSSYELRRYQERERRIATQRQLERRLISRRYSHSRYGNTRSRCR